MKEFTIGQNDAGQRVDRWLAKTLPLLPGPLAQKYLRLKRVKRNGKAAKKDDRLEQGALLQLLRAAQPGERLFIRVQAPAGYPL